ncbi:hypothetical protein IV203_031017 [Nitzschia inconspicua]|uniref:Uncharacterized protein n=1 Tax=Nitzschia inconspicua TaxID=303405 RepID=A0A9K3LUJ2_9STRA|nr:hypothetical protein IV203_031017 [Nitzschia inconspicua]
MTSSEDDCGASVEAVDDDSSFQSFVEENVEENDEEFECPPPDPPELPPDSLESINPDDPRYRKPSREDEKGDVQIFCEDQINIAPKAKKNYIFMLACSILSVDLETFHPYSKYQELSRLKKKPLRSLKPTKADVIMELKRRDDTVKP